LIDENTKSYTLKCRQNIVFVNYTTSNLRPPAQYAKNSMKTKKLKRFCFHFVRADVTSTNILAFCDILRTRRVHAWLSHLLKHWAYGLNY